MAGKRIMFVTPPYHCGVVEVAGRWMPLTFAYLADSARKAGLEPVIYDAMTKRHGFKEIRERISSVRPDYVATTAITFTAPDAHEVLRTAKEVDREIVTIIGGVHPTFLYRDSLMTGHCDYVVRGEGEETLRELLLALEGDLDPGGVRGIAYKSGHRVLETPPRPFLEDLDSLTPAWDLVEWKDYRYFVIPNSRLGAVSTSRGCNHDCTFCSQQKFWQQTWRGREPENVVREMEHLNSEYGVNVFLLPDEYPTRSRERWERLLDLLIERGMDVHILMETRAEDILRDRDILHKYRRAGVIHIYIGVEATDQGTLDLIRKDVKVETGMEAIRLIHEHGMITETSFILGFPHETGDSIRRTLELSRLYNPDFAHFLALAPWPYAEMYEEMRPHIAVHDYRKYNLIDPVIKPLEMSLAEVDRAIIDCYQSFYMGKLKEILAHKDGFKRRYMLHSMRLIMSSSFIVEKMGSLGAMPPRIKALMGRLEKEGPAQRDLVTLARRSISIDAGVGEVFAFVADPANWTRFINGLREVADFSTGTLEAGTTFRWTYRIKGIDLSGSGTVTDFVMNQGFSLQMHSLMPIAKSILVEGDARSARLTVEVGHRATSKMVGFLFSLVKKMLSLMEARAVLERIKALCEGEEAASSGKSESAIR